MVKAYIFDVFGTLVNWRDSVAGEIAPCLSRLDRSIDAHEVADLWRQQYQPSMAPIRAGQRPYVPLDVLHRENLDRVLEQIGLNQEFDENERNKMTRAWERLEPWSDVVGGLERLKQSAIIAPCSNGSIGLMTRLSKFAALPFDAILGADLAQSYKPDPAVYMACCRALRLEPGEVMMVAAHNDDLVAARSCGLKTAFIARPTEHGTDQTTDLAPAEDWDRVVAEIGELA